MKIVKLQHVTVTPGIIEFNALVDVVNALSERVFLTEQQLSQHRKPDPRRTHTTDDRQAGPA